MMLKPLTTEKAVMNIEKDNVLSFVVEKKNSKPEIKKEIEEVFEVKVDKIRTSIKNNKKYAYVKLNKDTPAIDLASKLGMM